MSSSRRSSHSNRSTATTRSARPPTWRATSLISGSAPGITKSTPPEVSIVFAEPETISGSLSASAAASITSSPARRSRLSSTNSIDSRVVLDRKNSSNSTTRRKLQDVFRDEERGEGSSRTVIGEDGSASTPSSSDQSLSAGKSNALPPASSSAILEGANDTPESSPMPFPSTSLERSTLSTSPAQPPPSSSSSPGRTSWFSSLGRSKGKGKAVDVPVNPDSASDVNPPQLGTVPESEQTLSVEATPKPPSKSLGSASVHIDGGLENNEALADAIDALGSPDHSSRTIRAAASPPVHFGLERRNLEVHPSTTTSDINSQTVRASERSKPRTSSVSSRHSWFNPFAPHPSSRTQDHKSSYYTSKPSLPPITLSAAPSTSTTSTSPSSPSLSRASSSFPSSIDDEVPGLVRTPAQSDDEDAQTSVGSRLVTKGSEMEASQTNEEPPAASSASSVGGQTVRARTQLDSINSLNPSTSRFSISIPLLGRPKMRLEDAVKRGQEEKTSDQESGPSTKQSKEAHNLPAAAPSTAADDSSSTLTVHLMPAGDSFATSASSVEVESGPAPGIEDIASTSEAALDESTKTGSLLDSSSPEMAEFTNDATPTQSLSSPSARNATDAQSWWSYVPGWGSSQPAVTENVLLPAGEKKNGDFKEDQAVEASNVQSEVPSGLQSPPPAAEPLPERPTSAPPVMKPSDFSAPVVTIDVTTAEPSSNTLKASASAHQLHSSSGTARKPPSVFSLETARAAGSWLSPWSWYGYAVGSESSANEPTDTASNITSTEGGESSSEPQKELTESEKIKEAALARDRQHATSKDQSDSEDQVVAEPATESLNPNPVPSASEDYRNPIADSASSLRSGWASFFSLSRGRGLAVKRLGDVEEDQGTDESVKRDENGVEVMDIEEDEDESVIAEAAESEKVVAKASPPSNALTLMRALAGQDAKKLKMLEQAPEKGQDDVAAHDGTVRPPTSPRSLTATKEDIPGPLDPTPRSPTKITSSIRKSRAASVSTTQTSNSSKSNRPAPPLTISNDLKASVAAAKAKAKRASKSPAPATAAGPSSVPSDGMATPPSGRAESQKEKIKPKPNKSGTSTPAPPPPPNLVLPAWGDTFHTLPRSWVPDEYLPAGSRGTQSGIGSTIGRTMRYVSGVLLGADTSSGYTSGGEGSRLGVGAGATKRRVRRGSSRRRSMSGEGAIPGGAGVGSEAELLAKEREKLRELLNWGRNLPRAWNIIDEAVESRSKAQVGKGKANANLGQVGGQDTVKDVSRGCKNVAIIGIHGWFPGAIMRSMLGEPTGTSPKFVNMMEQALEEFQSAHGVKFDKITKIPLEGEGTIDGRVEKLYSSLLSNQAWMDDLHNADVIFVTTHSQGSVVSTHLLDRLIRDKHIRTAKNGASEPLSDVGVTLVPLPPQRVCCLALCGIHLGPLRYLSSSSLLQPYFQYFESAAARELFEFQNTESEVSKAYVKALRNVVENETKMVYVASLNDQVVPIYSGLFTSVSHPLILRALYIDGDAYSSSDFLTNLLVLLLRILNCGLSDSGLLAHLSEVTAGSLNGIGHSTAYEELSTFSLAVNYLFLTNSGFEEHPQMTLEPFNASSEMNDYEIPWALRDLIADERVAHYFSVEITQLRDAFRDWHPKTTILRDIKRKLQPIQRLPSTTTPGTANSASKL